MRQMKRVKHTFSNSFASSPSQRDGSNLSGSGKISGSWWTNHEDVLTVVYVAVDHTLY